MGPRIGKPDNMMEMADKQYSRNRIALCILGVLSVTLFIIAFLSASRVQGPISASIAFYFGTQSIIFGIYTLWTSRQQQKVAGARWEEHLSRMELIAQSMSTRFIGLFPEHLYDIVEIVKRANKELLLLVDCSDYGSFPRPEAHQNFVRAIEDARRRKVEVKMLISGESVAHTCTSPFRRMEIEELSKTDEFKHYFEFWSGERPIPSTTQELVELLQKKEQNAKEHLREIGVDIKPPSNELTDKAGLFFWIEDCVEAVFLFCDPEGKTDADGNAEGMGLAFRTRDSKLIEVLVGTFNRMNK